MNILLLKPINKIYYVISPNLGLGYLASIMLDKGHTVKIMDSGKEKLTWNRFITEIQENKYDLIGIQVFTHELLSAKRHLELIKRFSPKTITLVGGAHISGDPEGTLNLLKDANFGFVGEGEIGVKQFLKLEKKDYGNPRKLAKISNLVWRKDGHVIVNPIKRCENLDKIKFPAWNLMMPQNYPIQPHGTFCLKTPVAPIVISRGCPFKCTFCAGPKIMGPKLRYRSLKNVILEILLLYKKYGVREIHIEDDNFTLSNGFVTKFCQKLIKLKLDLVWALPNGIRLDTLDCKLLKLMEKAGCYSFAVGIESGNDRILKKMKKSLTTNIIREKINLIKQCTSIHITGFFLLGFPTETKSEILQTIKFSKSLKIDKASFAFLMPLPGTEIWDLYKEKKGYQNIDWNNFFYYKIVPGVSDLNPAELRKLQKKAMREFYFRPRIIWNCIKEIKTLTQLETLLKRFIEITLSR